MGLGLAATRRLIQAMPKAEVHLHLDGCLRVQTALDLTRSRRIEAPHTFEAMFAALVADAAPGSQAALLDSFALPVALMQDAEALERVAAELVCDKAADGVRYMEIKWAPALHTERGLTEDGAIAAVCRGMKTAAAQLGVVATSTCVALRSQPPESTAETAEAAVRFRADGVTGFDLAGLEAQYPDPLLHASAFAIARSAGLGITVHAGELADDGEGVRRALELRPSRIAHGASVAGNAGLVAQLIERGVTLDLCPTSNVQANTVPSRAEHPAAELYRAGVGVTISTDDVTISDITLSEELLAAHTEIGFTLKEIWQLQLHALDVAFIDTARREALRAAFVAWADPIPELASSAR